MMLTFPFSKLRSLGSMFLLQFQAKNILGLVANDDLKVLTDLGIPLALSSSPSLMSFPGGVELAIGRC